MCGLVGVFGDINSVERRAFAELLQVDVLRGYHSTGVCLAAKRFKPVVIKDTILPTALLRSKAYYDVVDRPLYAMLGHNRAATVGDVTADNAHPFKMGDIYGTHNGTLFNTHRLEDIDPEAQWWFDTDSEAVFNTINKKGIEHTWSHLQGAATLVWFNHKTKTLNFIRNDKRPLVFAVSRDEKTVFWASEAWMLRSILERCFIPHEKLLIPATDHLFTFSIGKHKKLKREVEKLAPFEREYVDGSNENYPYKHDFKNERAYKQAVDEWWEAHNQLGLEDKDLPLAVLQRKVNESGNGTGKGSKTRVICIEGSGVQNNTGTKTQVQRGMDKHEDMPHNNPYSPKALGLSSRQFYKRYKQCTFCLETMSGNYHHATIIDDHNACCLTCKDIADLYNVNIEVGAKHGC